MTEEDSPVNSESYSLRLGGSDPYILLRSYAREAKIKSKAYEHSEGYYRWVYKVFTYPTVLLSVVSSVLAGIGINDYVLMCLSLAMLLLTGYNTVIAPKDKEQKANQIKTEFGEIQRNVKQFIYSNNRTVEEVKAYSETIHELINVWNSLSPPIQDKFITKAKHECVRRSRKHDHSGVIKKKVNITIDR